MQGGGDAANTLTCAARLGLNPRLISKSGLVSAPEEARVVYFDETALIVAQEEWTRAPFIASSLVSMMLRLPKLKFAIVTLGEEGCVMLERSSDVGHQAEEADVDCLLEILKQQKDDSMIIPTCVASLYAPACHLKGCCPLLLKWRLQTAELWGLGLVSHTVQIHTSQLS
ncbi:hypothetical protein CDL15_Pgr020106 [Punica granatum]|uniref:Carbohydrate kinase PfkB domain-containing protein n=1 Tax=Punica granatum TaxID=22663 RepID=A0A218VSC6_PUNGR|nr:hypothetical protein CDL15_Pgr020106 [Punica granatum]